jgi:hypothetical protein
MVPLAYLLILAILVTGIVLILKKESPEGLIPTEGLTLPQGVEDVLKNLESSLQHIGQIADEDLENMRDRIYMILEKIEDREKLGDAEKFSFFHPVNYRYWPQYYYSFPYQYQTQGAWPPGMYTSLTQWQPTFSTGSGWNLALRPGVNYKAWQRGRWVKNNGKYYFINNGGREDRTNDLYRMN